MKKRRVIITYEEAHFLRDLLVKWKADQSRLGALFRSSKPEHMEIQRQEWGMCLELLTKLGFDITGFEEEEDEDMGFDEEKAEEEEEDEEDEEK